MLRSRKHSVDEVVGIEDNDLVFSDQERGEKPDDVVEFREEEGEGEAQASQDNKYGHTRRGLKSRHIQLIALGGCIGTGLFVGTGETLSLVGPAPLFMGMLLPHSRLCNDL